MGTGGLWNSVRLQSHESGAVSIKMVARKSLHILHQMALFILHLRLLEICYQQIDVLVQHRAVKLKIAVLFHLLHLLRKLNIVKDTD